MRFNRRQALALSAAILCSCTASNLSSPERSFGIELDVFDKGLDGLIGPKPKATVLAQGFQWAEGPAWDLENNTLYFTDVPKNEAYSWSAANGLKVFLNPSGASNVEGFREPGANGLFFDYDSRLLLCNHGLRRIEYVLNNGPDRKVIAQNYEGAKFNSPNDIVATPENHIFFTDPPYGLEGLNESKLKELSFNGVYHITPDQNIALIDKSMSFPNGISISKDRKKLYVSQSDPDNPVIMCFELDSVYRVKKSYVFFDFSTFMGPDAHGLPDGMVLDENGNLFATGPGGIFIIRADGQLLGRLRLDRASSNCSFGGNGKALFVTNQDRLLRIETRTLGLRWV